ncbi:hypothetical protein [uncultured Psychroserpens sp.]|uniref:hypothetical protein n=1 Tax=uncultured Psychroserpens sp. TaxID=255436 RepID=UPI002607196A|nr:hypothetical protein [uncultured Psychroserpens sp.]
MNGPIILIVFISAFAIIGFVSYYFNDKNVIIRTLTKTPNKPTSSLKTNKLSKVTGKALHVKAPLIAPYTNRAYVFLSNNY